MHGTLRVPADAPVELDQPHTKSPAGAVARRDTLLPNEIVRYGDIAVTSAARRSTSATSGGATSGCWPGAGPRTCRPGAGRRGAARPALNEKEAPQAFLSKRLRGSSLTGG